VARQWWIIASAASLGLFIAIAVSLGLLVEPSYDPLRQGLSELVHSGAAPLAVLGFLAWAISLAALARLIAGPFAQLDRPRPCLIEAITLCVAAAALLLVAFFETDRGMNEPGVITMSTTTGRIHDLGSALVAASILIAITVDALRERDPRLALGVIGTALVSSTTLFVLGDPLPGLRQRCLVAAACAWQLAVLHRLSRRPTSDRSSAGSRCSTS
jgi:hypothetical protein